MIPATSVARASMRAGCRVLRNTGAPPMHLMPQFPLAQPRRHFGVMDSIGKAATGRIEASK
ncbi:hypothetical protein B484DRAFT_409460, partial [Ochromonadaceae sp. CCMP2298]